MGLGSDFILKCDNLGLELRIQYSIIFWGMILCIRRKVERTKQLISSYCVCVRALMYVCMCVCVYVCMLQHICFMEIRCEFTRKEQEPKRQRRSERMDKTESNSMKQIDHQVWIHTYNLSSREAVV